MYRGREDREGLHVPCAPDPRLASGISSLGSSFLSLGNIFCNKLTDVIQCFSDFSAVQAGYQIPGGNLGFTVAQ